MSINESSLLKEIIGPKDDGIDCYDESGDYLAFGVSRKAWGGEPMVDFISRDGNHQTFNYSHMYRVSFDPSKGLTVEFTNHVVMIDGQQLRDMHRFFVSHRVLFVCEADDATVKLSMHKDDAFVSKLEILDRNPYQNSHGRFEIQE